MFYGCSTESLKERNTRVIIVVENTLSRLLGVRNNNSFQVVENEWQNMELQWLTMTAEPYIYSYLDISRGDNNDF